MTYIKHIPDNVTVGTLPIHRGCIDSYTRKKSVNKRKSKEETTASSSKRLRSSVPRFNLREHCFFCGEIYQVEKDPKNPLRWRESYLCRTIDGKTLNKDTIIKKNFGAQISNLWI